MKNFYFILVLVFLVFEVPAQKPKPTFDHTTFGKRVVQYMNFDIVAACGVESDLAYIAKATGKTLEEVKTQREENLKRLREDIDFLNKNGILRIFDKAEVNIIQEAPIKIADIILYCHYKDKNYTLTLTNCIQTNTTWVLGDGIDPKGESIADLIAAKKIKDEKAANSFLGKLAAQGQANIENAKAQAKIDSAARIAEEERRMTTAQPRGYRAVLFPPIPNSPIAEYIRTDDIDKPLPGYYITKQGEKINAVIAYEAPEKLLLYGWNLAICKEANSKKEALYYDGVPNFLKSIKKDDLQAFYVGDQLFIQYSPSKWGILISEGAIRSLVIITKLNIKENTTYDVGNLIQKLGESAENHVSLSLQFKRTMSQYVKENTEMATKISAGAEGYGLFNLKKILAEYNAWYDQQFPDKVKYLPLGLPASTKPVTFISINTKEDLKSYLAQKEWEITSLVQINGNTQESPIEGADKIQELGRGQQTDKYWPIQLFSNGTALRNLKYYGKWETKDKHTVVINTNNGSPELFGIRFTQADQFVADTRSYSAGSRESISTFKIKKALTDSDWEEYDKYANTQARLLPTQFKGLVGRWTFFKMLINDADASDQFPLGKIEGQPITMTFLPDGFLSLQNGVRKANKIDMAMWSYEKMGDILSLMFYFDATNKVKEKIEKYTLVSVTDTELVYEDRAAKTKYIWTKK